jgi:maltose alpha-D-glucosyltransferase/alpha-amylase
MRLTVEVLRSLRHYINNVPGALQDRAQQIIDLEMDILQKFKAVRNTRITSKRIRIHGDYHLGQVLYTGKDFVITDFEGAPGRSISERRGKSSALQDVAGMLRSIDYASFVAAFQIAESPTPISMENMEPWRTFWYRWAVLSFLKGYFLECGDSSFMPATFEEVDMLLTAYLLERMLYEIRFEMNHRPDFLEIPLQGILNILNTTPTTVES